MGPQGHHGPSTSPLTSNCQPSRGFAIGCVTAEHGHHHHAARLGDRWFKMCINKGRLGAQVSVEDMIEITGNMHQQRFAVGPSVCGGYGLKKWERASARGLAVGPGVCGGHDGASQQRLRAAGRVTGTVRDRSRCRRRSTLRSIPGDTPSFSPSLCPSIMRDLGLPRMQLRPKSSIGRSSMHPLCHAELPAASGVM